MIYLVDFCVHHVPFLLFALSVLLSPLLVGTVHFWAVSSLLALLLIAVGVELWQRRAKAQATVQLTGWMLAFLLLSFWATLSWVPLPESLARLLSPEMWSIYHEGMVALTGKPPAAGRPLSLDPAQSADRALRWLVLSLGCFLAPVILKRQSHGVWLRRVIVGSGLLALCLGVINHLLGLKTFLGYPTTVPMRGWSPFVNTNHAAAFYGVCALVAMTSWLMEIRSTKQKRGKWIAFWASSIMIFLFASLLHESRSVMVFLVCCLGVLCIGFSERTMRGKQWLEQMATISRKTWAVVLGALVAVFLFVVYGLGAVRAFWSWADADGVSRWMVVKGAFLRSLDFWIVGSGAGSVDQVIYTKIDFGILPTATVRVAENEPVEWLLTMGWPVTILALIGLAASVRFCFPWLRDRGKIYLSRLALIAMLIFCSMVFLFHFPFVALGVGLPLLLAMEIMFARAVNTSRSSPHETKRKRGVTVSLRVATLVYLTIVALSGLSIWASQSLYQAPDVLTLDRTEVLSDDVEQRLIRVRPADGQTYAFLALQAFDAKKYQDARRLAARAYALEPMAPRALLYARSLMRAGQTEKAAGMYRSLFDGSFKSKNKQWALQVLDDVRDNQARASIFAQASPKVWRQVVAAISRVEGGASVQAFLLALVTHQPASMEIHQLLIESYIRTRQYVLAQMWSQLMQTRQFERPREAKILATTYLFRALIAQKKNKQAQDALKQAQSQHPDVRPLWQLSLTSLPDFKTLKSKPNTQDIQRIKEAHTKGCDITEDAEQAKICLGAKAWLAAANGQDKVAEELLKQMVFRFMDPQPLIQFYSAQKQCLRLKGFASQWGATKSKRNKQTAAERRVHERLRKGAMQCIRQ